MALPLTPEQPQRPPPATTPPATASPAVATDCSTARCSPSPMVQARWHSDARDSLVRKRSEGKTGAEARRCLKRHLAHGDLSLTGPVAANT